MTDRFANEQLTAYLDGELDPTELAELEVALREDAALRDELEALRGAVDFLRTHGPLHAPDGLLGAVLARVAEEPEPVVHLAAWWRRPMGVPLEALAAAAVALVVVGVGLLGTRGVGPAPTQAAPLQEDAAVADADPALLPSDLSEGDEAQGGDDAKVAAGAVAPSTIAPPKLAEGAGGMRAGTAAANDAKGEFKPGEPASELLNLGARGTVGAGKGASLGGGDASGATQPPPIASGFSYRLANADPDVVAGLLRVAAKHRGRVEDGAGQAVDGSPLELGADGTYFVHLPATEMAKFARELASLGAVSAVREDDWFGGDVVRIRVDVSVADAQAKPASKASTKASPTSAPEPALDELRTLPSEPIGK